MKPQGLLSDRFVRRVRPDPVVRHYTDGRGAHGLSLRVQPNGFRHWYQHIKIDGRYTNLGLGGYPIVTLEEARAEAAANARLVAEGGDPRKTKRGAPTVAQVLDALIARDSATWRNAERTARDWRRSLTNHAPAILRRRRQQPPLHLGVDAAMEHEARDRAQGQATAVGGVQARGRRGPPGGQSDRRG